MKKLSIITINFNNSEGLEKTIESVIQQKYTDFEYIIIDGGSTDRSLDILKKYSNKIAYWISEQDKGIYNAQNKGIACATGAYCLFLNSGDFLCNDDVLEKVFSKKNEEDIVYGDMIIDYGNGNKVYGSQPNRLTSKFFIHSTLWHPVSFIKRTLFDKYGKYNEDYKIISDYEFFVKTICISKVTTRHISIPISVFNTDGIGSSSAHDSLHQSERKLVQEKYFSKEEIESAKMFYAAKKNRQLTISNWFKKHLVIKKVALMSLNIIKKIKNIFKTNHGL